MRSKNWVLEPGKYLRKEEANRLLNIAKHRAQSAQAKGGKVAIRDYFIIHLVLSTGLRVMEVAALKCGDVFLDDRICSIFVRKGKGNKKRLVYFTGPFRKHCRYSSFSGAVSMVIAVCVSMLCVISILGGSLPENGSPQEPTPVFQKDISPQEPPQYRFNPILLPYMALMMSFLLLLILAKIGLLADGENSNSRKSRRDWDIRKQPDKRKRYLR